MTMQPTVFKLGYWNQVSDTFVAHPSSPTGAIFDLNDGSTFTLVDENGSGDGLDLGMPQATLLTSSNVQTIGERVPRRIYDKNRTVTARLFWGRGSTYATWVAQMHNLIGLTESISPSNPAALQIQTVTGITYYYLDVLAAQVFVPYEELKWAQLSQDGVTVTFTCKPFFRGARQVHHNLVLNPGFEGPSQTSVLVYEDPMYNNNGYTVNSGSLGTDTYRYTDAIQKNTPLRYYRLDESSGTTAYDAMGAANGTISATGVTLSAAGALTGDSDTAFTFTAASTGSVLAATTGLPTGASAWSIEAWIKFAANPAGNQVFACFGGTTTQRATMYIDSAGKLNLSSNGTDKTISTNALSTGAYHHVVGTYNGTTLTIYVDGVSTGTPTASSSNVGTTALAIGSAQDGTSNCFNGQVDEVAIYGTALSASIVNQHYTAGTISPASSIYATTVMYDQSLIYYRFGEAAGTTATDMMRVGNGTYTGVGVTYAQAGALSGDANTAVLFNGSSGCCSVPTGSLPTGSNAVTLEAWVFPTGTPAGDVYVWSLGNGTTAGQILYIAMTNSRTFYAGNGSVGTAASSAVTLSTWHHVCATWNGSTISFYLDGTLVGTSTTTTLNLTYGGARIGARNDGAANFFQGRVDEPAIYSGVLTSYQISKHNAIGTSTPIAAEQKISVPAAGRFSYGSPNWTDFSTWQIRFRYVTSLTATFYYHYVDANNYLAVGITGTQLSVSHSNGGISATDATQAINLINNVEYWIVCTQFPSARTQPTSGSTQAPNIQFIATIYNDVAENRGSNVVGSISTAAIPTTSGISQNSFLSGAPSIAAAGATLALGGKFDPIRVELFGPGGWSFAGGGFSGDSTIAPAVGAWDQFPANTYSPIVTSFGSARVDVPPAGVWSSTWSTGAIVSFALASSQGVAVNGSDTINCSFYLKTSGMSNTASYQLYISEYDAARSFLRQTSVASTTGNVSSWTKISGTLALQSTTVYCSLSIQASDAVSGASAGGKIWYDQVHIFDQTTTGMTSMPYCDMSAYNAPFQMLITGIQGDVPAPALFMMGVNTGVFGWGSSGTVSNVIIGRRSNVSANSQLIVPPWTGNTGVSFNRVIDTTAWYGYSVSSTGGEMSAPLQIMPQVNNFIGQFELMAHAKLTGAGSPTAWALDGGIKYVSGLSSSFSTTLPKVYPFSGSNWTLGDIGSLTPGSVSGASELDANAVYCYQFFNSYASGGGTMTSDYSVLIPTDTEYLRAILTMSVSSLPAGYWVWMNWDGLSQTTTFSTNTTNALPTPTQSILSSGGFFSVAAVGDSIPQLDPTIALGVNQFVVAAYDVTGNNQEVMIHAHYSPLYLLPR